MSKKTFKMRLGEDLLDTPCPKCKRTSVTYNGNYYCVEYECQWCLTEENFTKDEYDIVVEWLTKCVEWSTKFKPETKKRYERSLQLLEQEYPAYSSEKAFINNPHELPRESDLIGGNKL